MVKKEARNDTLTLNEIAKRIDAHLKRFERDPKINTIVDVSKERLTQRRFYYASAMRAGNRVRLVYVCYQTEWNITKPDAIAYLAWLDAGNVGTHYTMEMKQKEKRKS